MADRFNKKTRNQLFRRILAWTPYSDSAKSVTLKILVIGPENSGKSAFIRSLVSIFQGKIITPGDDEQCDDKTLTHGRKTLPITMCECHDAPEDGRLYDQVLEAFETLTPHNQTVSTDTMPVMTEEMHPDTLLRVIFVFDAQNLPGLTQSDFLAQCDKVTSLLKQNGIPRSVVMTHVDALAPDIPSHFWNNDVQSALSLGQALFDVPVFPVMCYTDQPRLQQNRDILLLDALNSIL